MKPILLISLLLLQFTFAYDTAVKIQGYPATRDIAQTSDVFGPPVSRRLITKAEIRVSQISVDPIIFSPDIPEDIRADEKLLELVWEDDEWSLIAWFRQIDGEWISFGEEQRGGVRF
jgi:hypothetical protein